MKAVVAFIKGWLWADSHYGSFRDCWKWGMIEARKCVMQ